MKLALSNSVAYGYATGDPSAQGGAERAQWLLARALVETGWSVTIGVRGRLSFRREHRIDGVRFVGMSDGHLVGAWSRFLADEKPDWWYWRSADPLLGALLMVARARGVRGIFSVAFDTDVEPRKALTRRRRWWPLYAWALNAVDRIFLQHKGQLDRLNGRLRPKAVIVPGVVSLPERVKTVSERGGYVAWIGVLREPKRPDLLVELARRNPDLRFVACGGTSAHRSPAGYSERMARLLGSTPNIEYRGHVHPAEAIEIASSARVLLSTSAQEGFPNTFLEAWAAGTPVVSLTIDPGGVIRERGLGCVSGGVDEAGKDLQRLVASPELAASIGSRARAYVEEVHSSQSVARIFESAIRPSMETPVISEEVGLP